ncbi:unnamed protein product [Blepharisma stoltei]|uniref:Uncharacterized protein n=1 Tax=Blepharisma stoltei TaxID=1481888 RepID=A0AAU9JEF9_9CILI|nr:unnamed protein product [Blepharisma stoltei]
MESRKNLKELENIKIENKWDLLLFQIITITSDINSKLKEIESSLNIINILIDEIAEILSRPSGPFKPRLFQ